MIDAPTATLDLTFFSDPGHGWLQVPKTKLLELNIHNMISGYSYEDRFGNAYLEEDCDMDCFMKAAGMQGWQVKITSRNEPYADSFVRGLKRYGG